MPTFTKYPHEARALDRPAPSSADALTYLHRETVQRILVSPTFARSERLSALLTYVCEMALTGRESELNEQRLGQAVFGRSPAYDSSADGIVRTQASRLRQRLDLFYEQEGRDEAVRVLIPKGGYIPLFQQRQSTPEILAAATSEPKGIVDVPETPPTGMPAAAPHSYPRWLPWLCALLACAFAGLSIAYKLSKPRPEVPSHPLWGHLFMPGRPTLEVPGDSGLVLSYVIDQRDVSLHDYLSGEYLTRTHASGAAFSGPLATLKTDFANRRYTALVDLETTVKLVQLAQEARSSLQIRYARDLRPNDLKNQNVILIGAREANPWVELFEHRMNFVLQDDHKTVFSVLNRSPNPGEPSRWISRSDDPEHRVYGVVAFVPNLSGSGNALLIEGTSMAGTEAAWDFVSDNLQLLPFLRQIQRPDGSTPHFELLVGTQNMNASAVHDELIAWRVID